MKIYVMLFPFLISLPLSAEPVLNGNIIDSSGPVDELLSVSFSMALTHAIKYYNEQAQPDKKQNTVILPPNAYSNTINAVSRELTSILSLTDFYRLNGLSYANLFLNAHVVNISMFNADNLSSDFSPFPASIVWSASLPSDTYYDGQYGQASLTNPLPLFSFKNKSDTLVSSGVTRIANNRGEDVYQFPYSNRYIVSDTPDNIADFLQGLSQDAFYAYSYNEHLERESVLLNTFDNKGNPLYSHCAFTTSFNKKMTPVGSVNNYSVNGHSVSLNSAYKMELEVTAKSDCFYVIDGAVSNSYSYLDRLNPNNSTITINAPLYTPDELINAVISPFEGDATLQLSYSAAMGRGVLLASAFSSLLNTAWASAASVDGYDGVPYTSSLSVTSGSVSQVMNERSLRPTGADLFVQVQNGSVHLMQWDDNQKAFISNDMVKKQESVSVDFGPNPNTPAPEIENTGTLDTILSPITSVLPFLQKFELNSHAVQCPIISIPVFNDTYSMDSFCILAERYKQLIALFFIICWSMSGLFILVR